MLDAMKNDPTFWSECGVCDRPATMHHQEHAGTNDDGPVVIQAVHCDVHSAERVHHNRTFAAGPLSRPPTDGEEVPES